MSLRAAFGGAAALVALAIAPGASAATPRVLVESRYDIPTVAQDAGRIAWVVARPNPRAEAPWDPACSRLYVRRLRGARSVELRRSCAVDIWNVQLVGRRAAWYEPHHGPEGSRYSLYWAIKTAALGDRTVRTLRGGFYSDERSLSGDATSLSGDAGTLAYSWSRFRDANGCDLMFDQDCTPDVSVTGGGAWRIVGARAVPIPGLGPTSRLEAGSGRIARLSDGEIEVRDAVTGESVSRIPVSDYVVDFALSRTTIAIVLRALEADEYRTEVYDLATGALSRVIRRRTAEVDVDGARVAFVATGGVWVADGAEPSRRLWRGVATPQSLSVDGNRLVWAVGTLRRDRILALTVPR